MKSIHCISLVSAIVTSPVLAQPSTIIDGNQLYEGYQLYQKGFDYLKPEDAAKAMMYMAYVAGVAGTMSTLSLICSNDAVSIDQEADIVGQYLSTHPRERSQYSPTLLSMTGLGQAMPCKGKSY